jgi:hypothetical protein
LRTDELIRALVEALVETSKPGEPRHPVVAEGLDWLRRESERSVTRLPGWVQQKQCYHCNDAIWFARRRNGSWVPLIPVPLQSGEPVIDALSVDFSNKEPTILETTEPGTQWLPHRVLCGRLDRPVDEELGHIWDLTTGRELVAEREAVSGLLDMLEESE